MTEKIKPALRCTKNYDLFTLHEHNRDYHEDKALAESMRKYGFLPCYPIHVDGNMRIIAGHHRFAEAKRQGLPVWYIKDDTAVPIFVLEGVRCKWSNNDFAAAYAKAGNPHYMELVAFMQKYKISIVAASSLLHGENAQSGNKIPSISSGKFVVKDRRYANEVMGIVEVCAGLGIEFARQRAFISAISAMIRLPEFDKERFLARVRLYPKHMTHRATKFDYMEEIESLYNYTTREKVPLSFLARQSGFQRMPQPLKVARLHKKG